MLSGSTLQRLLIIVSALGLVGSIGVACKKKSKKKGAAEESVKEDKKNAQQSGTKYDVESLEGNFSVFRGSDKIFYIRAPHKVVQNTLITFEGSCGASQSGSLTWNFGKDLPSKVGSSVTYTYATAGTYKVTGTCEVSGAGPQIGTLTIIVTGALAAPNNPNGGTPYQNSCNTGC